MALDQVLSDKDSEDEVDDDIADLEDRRVGPVIPLILQLMWASFLLKLQLSIVFWGTAFLMVFDYIVSYL